MKWIRYNTDTKQIKHKNATEIRKQKIIVRLGNQLAVFNLELQLGHSFDQFQQKQQKKEIELFISEKWGLHPDDYYLTNLSKNREITNNFIVVEIQPRFRGGSVKSMLASFFRGIINAFMAIFKPIIKPLIGIANAFLMLVKGIVYVIMLLTWFIKFLAWIFTEILPSIPTDIFGLVRFLAAMLIDAVVGTFMYYFRKLFNSAGSTVIGTALSGWDNNPETDDTPNNSAKQTASEFEDSKTNSDTENQSKCEGRKCYRTEAGTVPWTVILATVLFPPAGVFMELGLHGWLQILVCLLLTFMFYFPGLIYALILLYC
jgi:uncharacterized membrane protein YqaE (UPF0057 family)